MIGYIISAVLFITFQVLSFLLKFSPSNTVWALAWLTAVIVPSYITIINKLRDKKARGKLHIALFIVLSLMLFAEIVIIIGAVIGIPECRFPLY